MTRVAAQIELSVPAERCQEALQAAILDERLRDAYRGLRAGKEYSGWVTAFTPGRSLEISFAALELASGWRTYRLGWRVTYDFLPLEDGRTRVEVAVSYGLMAALGAAGTLRFQAENEVANRLATLHALEVGLKRGAAP